MEGIREEVGELIAGRKGREGMQSYIIIMATNNEHKYLLYNMVLVYNHTQHMHHDTHMHACMHAHTFTCSYNKWLDTAV